MDRYLQGCGCGPLMDRAALPVTQPAMMMQITEALEGRMSSCRVWGRGHAHDTRQVRRGRSRAWGVRQLSVHGTRAVRGTLCDVELPRAGRAREHLFLLHKLHRSWKTVSPAAVGRVWW